MKQINYVETEGWVTEEWLMWEFIKSMKETKEFKLFKTAIVERTREVHE